MNERKWLESTKPRAMLRFLKGKVSERKLRLVAVAVHREYHRLDPRFSGPESSLAAETAEAFAEAGSLVDTAIRLKLGGYFILNPTAYGAASRLVENSDIPDAFKCSILRCVFGLLPFHPIVLDPTWLTPGVVGLASFIYQKRAFDRLPDLAVLLEARSCNNADLLQHCRESAPHTRGCWPLDAILGRS
jgi:hypothetical protein